jgi:hypothetical protein
MFFSILFLINEIYKYPNYIDITYVETDSEFNQTSIHINKIIGNCYYSVSNSLFINITHNSRGGSIYISGDEASFVSIFQNVFIKCSSSSNYKGGALYIQTNDLFIERNCAFYCKAYQGQFLYCSSDYTFITPHACSFITNSVLRCVDNFYFKESYYRYTLYFDHFYLTISEVNSTFNYCNDEGSILGAQISNSFSLTFSNFLNNTDNLYHNSYSMCSLYFKLDIIPFLEFNYLNFINCVNYGNKGSIIYLSNLHSNITFNHILFSNCISYYIFYLYEDYNDNINFSSIYLYKCYYYDIQNHDNIHSSGISFIYYYNIYSINFQNKMSCYVILIPGATTYISKISIPFTPNYSNSFRFLGDFSLEFFLLISLAILILAALIIVFSPYFNEINIFNINNLQNPLQFLESNIA